MIIESVELDNFKSFGKKKVLFFNRGLTILTGPNGSGKSNIGDAMLFVLGIRSSKAIRADRLPDLIHRSGPDKRQRNSCSVTITMNSEDDSENEEQRRTTITREISVEDQECKSTYYINGMRSRRSDVEAFLDNAQIYLDGYSFVLQGDINNLVKMTGTERRKLLESIAGIESYNVQIEKAEIDKEAIEDNLSKIQILIDETRRRVDQLSDEKENAEKYIGITERIGSLEATLLQIELLSAEREREGYTKSLAEIEKQITDAQTKIVEINVQIGETEEKIRLAEEEKIRFGGEDLKRITELINSLTLDKAREEMQRENLEDEVSKLTDRIDILVDSNKALEKEITDLRASRDSIQGEIKSRESSLSELGNRLSELRTKTSDSSKLLAKYRKEQSEIDEKLERINEEIEKTYGADSKAGADLEAFNTNMRHLETRESDLLLEINDAKYKIDTIEKESEGKKRSYDNVNRRYLELRKAVTEGDQKKDELNRQLIELTREYEKLSALASKSTQSSRAYSVILEGRASGEISGIHGMLRDLISYDSKYAMAIASAGGGRLQAVVVEDDGVAESCLNFLKKRKAGKLTFLPLNKMLNGRPRAKAIMVRNSGESLGYVFENIRYDKKYENIIWYGFQDCLVVPDVQVARKHMTGVRLVTLDGDIFEASGAITGGYVERREDVSEKRISEIADRMSAISSELDGIKTQLEVDRSDLDRISTELATTSKTVGSGSSQISVYEEIRDKSTVELKKIRESLEALKVDIAQAEAKVAETSGARDQKTEERESLQAEKTKLNAKMSEISPEMMGEQNRIEDEIAKLRTEKDALSSNQFSIASDVRIKEKIFNDQAQEIKSSGEKIESNRDLISSIEVKVQNLKAEIEKNRLVEEQLNIRAKEYNDRITRLNVDLQAFRGNIETTNALISSYTENRINTTLRISTIVEKVSQIRLQIQESKYQPSETDRSATEIKRTVNTLRKELEALGAVNLLAIKEYEEESARLADLEDKTARLNSEKKSLEDMMESLNQKKRTVFLELYYKINQSMGDIYTVLSDGGEARLDLSDINDPLNSDLYIRARPKGSTFSKIEALSGGEKSLTAISFILAVQRIKPSPVYYLDEIDMFLDGANVERIGRMFAENARYAQVLLVSLKKAMLKYADNLIGVTILDDDNSEVYSKDFERNGVEP